MKLVPTTQHDEFRLWQWRNDSAYRRYCGRLSLISFVESVLQVQNIIGNKDNVLLIADHDNTKVGFVMLCKKKGGVCEINLCVDREKRGEGLGTSMIGLSSEYAMQNMGARSLVAYIHTQNYKALWAFDKMHWKDAGMIEDEKGVEWVKTIYP